MSTSTAKMSPVSATHGRSNDTNLPTQLVVNQSPLTDETPDRNIHTVHPLQDEGHVGGVVQHQDCRHSQLAEELKRHFSRQLEGREDNKPDTVLPQHCKLTLRPYMSLSLEPEPPGHPTPTLPQGEHRPPLLAGATPWKGSDTVGSDLDGAGGSVGSPPALVITQAEESEEGADDDTRSVASSSVMSLYNRVHLDPLEKDWLRSSVLGNICALRLLLLQDPTLAHKKDFVTTALHWAAKQGRLDTVDLMFLSGVDVNVRSGYTALHLASIHSHQPMVLALINTYHAKTDIKDYHGKKAIHYWSGGPEGFNKPGPLLGQTNQNTETRNNESSRIDKCEAMSKQTGGKLTYGRRSQRYPLPARLLSRSRSQSQLSLDFTTAPQSPRLHILDIHMDF